MRPLLAIALATLSLPAAAQGLPMPATEEVFLFGVPGSAGASSLVIHPTDPLILYWAAGEAGVLKSTDGTGAHARQSSASWRCTRRGGRTRRRRSTGKS